MFFALHPVGVLLLSLSGLLGVWPCCWHGTRSGLLAQRLLKQGCRCRPLPMAFSGLCYRCCGFVSRLSVGLKSLLRRGLLEPAFYGYLVYKLKKMFALVVFQLALLK